MRIPWVTVSDIAANLGGNLAGFSRSGSRKLSQRRRFYGAAGTPGAVVVAGLAGFAGTGAIAGAASAG